MVDQFHHRTRDFFNYGISFSHAILFQPSTFSCSLETECWQFTYLYFLLGYASSYLFQEGLVFGDLRHDLPYLPVFHL